MTDAQIQAPGRSIRRVSEPGEFFLICSAAVLVAVAVVSTAVKGVAQPHVALAFGALIALGELLRLSLPGGRESAPVAIAGGLSYALLLNVGTRHATQGPLQVVLVAGVGMILGALPHLAAGRPPGAAGMASRLMAVAVVAFSFRPLSHSAALSGSWPPRLAVMAAVLIAGALAECLVRAMVQAVSVHARFRVALWDEVRAQLPLAMAVASTAILIAEAAHVMGLAALAVFIAPLLVTQVALRRFAGIRATYLDTVRALARVTEIGGYVEDGHAHRVGQLAVAVGRELGMGEVDLLELEYAALMHDIGQLSLRDPIPGGATVLASREDQRRIAELGAGVIEQAGVLDGVAEIVRCQGWPWRGPGGEPPVGSRIIRAANAFDDLVGTSADASRSAAALERLRLDTQVEYDPRVVTALARVAGRRRAHRR